MPVVTFANRKGGVGKTLSTLYTGRWLARAGRDVTLVDLDPQKSLWDIAALLGRPDGAFSRHLHLTADSLIPEPTDAQRYALVDTPPALDGSLPALNQADYLVIPVIPEAQEVAQLAKFLDMLHETRHKRPFTRTLGVLPVRYIRHWPEHRAVLDDIHTLAGNFGLPVLDPVPHSRAVSRYSLAGGLWRQVSSALINLETGVQARAA